MPLRVWRKSVPGRNKVSAYPGYLRNLNLSKTQRICVQVFVITVGTPERRSCNPPPPRLLPLGVFKRRLQKDQISIYKSTGTRP